MTAVLPSQTQRPAGSVAAAVSVAAALFVGACAAGSTPSPASPGVYVPPVVPVIASSELVLGKQRFLFTLIDQANRRLAAPDVAVHLRFFDLAVSDETPAGESDAVFFWAIPDSVGLYRAAVEFGEAGKWAAELAMQRIAGASSSPGALPSPDPLASPVTVRIEFDVRDRSSTPAIGAPAPEADIPTLETAGGDPRRISTDQKPDPRLYGVSIRQALAAKRPFLLIFATPAFCQTAMCGPTLEVVRQVLADYPTLTAIHVEPYQLEERDGTLQPVLDADGKLQPVPAVTAWGLIVEPYTFLVDGDGKIAAKFEGPIDRTELREAIDALPPQ